MAGGRKRRLSVLRAHALPDAVRDFRTRYPQVLRGYVYNFIETFASPLKREVVVRALASAPGTRFEG